MGQSSLWTSGIDAEPCNYEQEKAVPVILIALDTVITITEMKWVRIDENTDIRSSVSKNWEKNNDYISLIN